MTSLRIVERIEVASPCTADWAKMSGSTRVRHCGDCEKSVYNLSAMTEPEIESLVIETEGQFCGRFFRRPDGTMLTADCPVGLAAKIRRATRRATWAAAALVATLFGTAGAAFFGFGRSAPIEQAPGGMLVPLLDVEVPMGVVEIEGEIEVVPEATPTEEPDQWEGVQGGIGLRLPESHPRPGKKADKPIIDSLEMLGLREASSSDDATPVLQRD